MRMPTTTGVLPIRILGNTSVRSRTTTSRFGLNPRHADAYNNRGIAYESLGQHQRAIQDYDEAIRLNPRVATPTTTGVMPIMILGNTSVRFRTTIRRLPLIREYAKAYAARAIAEVYLHRDAAAESDFKRAFELDPELKRDR